MLPQIKLEEFNYSLPIDRIAKFPLENRDESKLLIVDKKNSQIRHKIFKDIASFIPENSHLVINETKVIFARLLLKKQSGGKAELLCVKPKFPSNDPQITMSAKKNCIWECIVGGKKIRENSFLYLSDNNIDFSAKILKRTENRALVEFKWNKTNFSFSDVLLSIGRVPLPPYIKRDAIESDKTNYQTVYANIDGSVAAPTAGLHFTPEVLNDIQEKKIDISKVILHVGPGTFKPIDTDNVSNHNMHSEQIFITKTNLQSIIKAFEQKKYIIPTGTTSLRTLESLYWLGVKILDNRFREESNQLKLEQWEAYNLSDNVSALKSFTALIEWLDKRNLEKISAVTKLFIIPGYEFKTADGLITNFHLPKSTLILLVASFIGKELWERAYKEALANNYRFLSYGDSSLLLR